MTNPSATILVIGYGNELRSDDAAGPRVAASVAELQLPGVEVLIRQQLAPELAEKLAQARAALFVDATLTSETDEVLVRELEPGVHSRVTGHVGTPPTLLALARELYGGAPPAWLVTIPGRNFGFGESLSAVTARGVETAVGRIRELVLRVQSARK